MKHNTNGEFNNTIKISRFLLFPCRVRLPNYDEEVEKLEGKQRDQKANKKDIAYRVSFNLYL
jgi:hypothetical protein